MNNDLINNLIQQENTKERKHKHNQKREMKVKRRKVQNDKIKETMEKQKLDEIRGATYQFGKALKHLIPNTVLKIKEEIKLKGNIHCHLFGYNDEKKHKSERR